MANPESLPDGVIEFGPEDQSVDEFVDDGMTDERLIELIDGDGTTETEDVEPEAAAEQPEPTPEPEAAPGDETVEETEDETAETEPEAETEPDDEVSIRLAQLQAQLEFQKAHNSRLAGTIGGLKQQLDRVQEQPLAAPADADPSDPYQQLLQQNRQILERVKTIEARPPTTNDADQLRSAMEQRMAQIGGGDLTDEIKEVAPKFTQQWQQVLDTPETEYAVQMGTALIDNVVADAREVRRQRGIAKEVDQAASLKKRKMAASITTSTKRPATKKRRSLDDLTDEQIAQLIDEGTATVE